jgi:hypothetical protein
MANMNGALEAPATKEPDFQAQADEYAHRSIESLRDMLDALEHAERCDKPGCKHGSETCTVKLADGRRVKQMKHDNPEAWHDPERARQAIQEDPLSIEVRSGWHTPGDEDGNKPAEYNILLGTGGPAARIIGELDEHGQPETATFEFQDWFKPWTAARVSQDEEAVMLKYAQQFYFEA